MDEVTHEFAWLVDHEQPDEQTFALEHGHDHNHPEVGHPDGPLHHEQWGTNHAHEHRWYPIESHHHYPVDPAVPSRPGQADHDSALD